MVSSRWALGWILLAAGCGTKGNGGMVGVPPPPGADAGADAVTNDLGPQVQVSGQVVDDQRLQPLAGREVSIGQAKTVTGDDGRFTLPRAGGPYDLRIADTNGLSVSFYQGLERNDPVLIHRTRFNVAPRFSQLSGTVSGVGTFPIADKGNVDFYFVSAHVNNWAGIGYLHAGRGPAYGPMNLGWEGPQTLSGQLFALGQFGDSGAIGFAQQPLTVTAGTDATASVTLSPVASTTHLSGTITVPQGQIVTSKGAFLRLPVANGAITLVFTTDDAKPTFDHLVPVLPFPLGLLCVTASAGPAYSVTQRCGLPAPTDIDLIVQESPALTVKDIGTPATPDTAFSWTPFANGIYQLRVDPDPSQPMPLVTFFTSQLATTWRALAAMGVTFSTTADARVTLIGVAPLLSMDEAVGPDGLAAPHPAERRQASQDVSFRIGP